MSLDGLIGEYDAGLCQHGEEVLLGCWECDAPWPDTCPTCGTALRQAEIAPGIRIPVDSEDRNHTRCPNARKPAWWGSRRGGLQP